MSKARDIADGIGGTNPNLIINGAMNVHQRGGTSTSSGYLIDRFTFTLGTVGVTRSQDTDVPSGQGFSNSLKHLNTSTTTATNAYCASQTHIEAQDIRNSGWDYTNPNSYITVSFWAKSSIDGTYYMTLRTEDGTSYEYCSPYTLAANTWKRVDFQIAGNSNLAFDNNNSKGLTILPFIEMGSDYTDSSMPEDAWAAYSGTAQTPDKQSNFMSTSGAAFWYTGVKLEVGSVATPFEHRSYGEELALCQRYFFKQNNTFRSQFKASGSSWVQSLFPVTMRTSPTLSNVSTSASGGVTNYSNDKVMGILGSDSNDSWTWNYGDFDAEL